MGEPARGMNAVTMVVAAVVLAGGAHGQVVPTVGRPLVATSTMAAAQPAQAQAPAAAPAPAAVPAVGQGVGPGTMPTGTEPFEARPIRAVRVEGLKTTDETLVRNQIRTREGAPLDPESVRGDIQRLNRLGRFRELKAKVLGFDDGSVELIYQFVETPIIEDVEVVGNRQVTNNELQPLVDLLKGTPVEDYQLGAARVRIQEYYKEKGYYQAQVTIDQKELEENSTILFRIVEGERLKVSEIRFTGNVVFSAAELSTDLKTKAAGVFESGPLDNDAVDQDVATIIGFYRDRGHLDVRADRRLIFSPDSREVIVEFQVEEGPRYTMRSVRVESADPALRDAAAKREGDRTGGLTVFSQEQIAGLMSIKAGDALSAKEVRLSIDAVQNAYLRMGYVDARVEKRELRDPGTPEVDLLIVVQEGRRYRAGLITISGNQTTQQKVVRRELELRPDRPLDASFLRAGGGTAGGRVINENERRVRETRLFRPDSVKLTTQPERPENPGYRDVLLEVEESTTGQLSFGAGVNSDAGVVGILGLEERNFDILDWPESVDELLSGRAFRGAGQTFRVDVQPGTDTQNYQLSLADPAMFDSDYAGTIAGYYRVREYEQFDEDRLGGRVGFGRRFGERWQGNVFGRYELVNIRDIDADAPVDLFEVEGESTISSIGVALTRTSVDSRFRPTSGSRIEFGVERAGALGGDYDFTRFTGEYQLFLPLYEDFFGNRTVLSFKSLAGYIPEGPDDAPIFERLYLGGRTMRGFAFRTVSPKGIQNDTGLLGDDPVGGTWQFFAGFEVEQPVYQDVISIVGFVDSGTVTNDIGFDDYRLSVGLGLRIYVEQLSPAPFAFDFGFPLVKKFGDQERVFSFTIDLPF